MAAAPHAAFAQSTEDVRDEIIVVGSRIPRPDAQAASPVASFDRDAINTFKDLSVEDFIGELPIVTPDFSRAANNPGGGISTINLRGLGSQRTLVLLNGRRLSPAGVNSAVDVNTIPSALVERLEIATGGASAVYGSDAVAGAVNFVTRDFNGIEVSGQFDIYGAGDGESYNASIAAGTDFADGRGHISVYGDFLKRTDLLAADREFTSVILGEDRSTGELFPRGSGRVPEGAIFQPTAMLNGEIVFPIFNQDGSFRAFTDNDYYNFAPENYLQTPLERWSGGAFIDYELTGNTELFAELMFSRPVSDSQLAPAASGFTAQFAIDSFFFADSTREELRAAYDPDNDGIGQAFMVRRLSEVGPRHSQRIGDYYRGVFGFRTQPATEWAIEGFYGYGRNESVETLSNDASLSRLRQGLLVDPMTGQCVDPSGGCVPVNIFGLGNLTPEAVEFIRVDNIQNATTTTQHNAALVATGELLEWSGGTVRLSSGVEFRRNTAEFVPSSAAVNDIVGFNTTGDPLAGGVNIYEAFSELVVPLVQGQRFFEHLELEAGGRFSHYSTAGDSWTWKFGGQWFPFEQLRLRGMWQRAVRAPNIDESLRSPRSTTTFLFGEDDFCLAVNDPIGRGLTDICVAQGMDPAQVGVYDLPPGIPIENFATFINGTESGNPNLDPERADTITFGGDYTFDTPFHLRIGADYFDIKLEGAISEPQSIPALCALSRDPNSDLCGALTRAPDGTPLTVTFMPLNIAVARVEGIDITLDFSADAPAFLSLAGGAEIGIRTQATQYLTFGQATTESTPFINCAGGFEDRCAFSPAATTFPDTLVTTTFSYDAARWGAALKWRWIDGVEHFAPVFDALENLPPPVLPIPFVDDRHYLDAAIRFDFSNGVRLRAGVDNLLATDPPQLADEQSQNSTDPGRYTVYGRRIFVALQMSFGAN